MDDVMDAVVYAMEAARSSPTGREVQAKMHMAQKIWAAHLGSEIMKSGGLGQMLATDFAARPRGPSPTDLMRGVLQRLKSKHLPGYMQMSPARRTHFIERVERHGAKQYSNQQHMRDIHAAFKAEQVYHALKD